MSNYQKIIISISIILFALAVTFKDVINGNKVFSTPDSQSASSVGKGMESYKVENGEYPKWNPWIFSGVPSTHSLQHISRFYPPNFIFKHLNKIGVPGFINYLLHFLFAGFGCFLILYKRKVNYWASIYVGLSFALTPGLIQMIVHGHGSKMLTSAYIPWIFYALDRLRENINIKNTSILSLLVGFQLLRAHVQIAYYTWLIIGVYILFYFISDYKNKKLRISYNFYLYTFIALIIGFGTAIQLYYPALSYSNFSIRGGSGGGTGFDYATMWSFSMGEMLTFINPNYFGFGGSTYWGNIIPFTDYPNYMGILTISLMLVAIFNIRNTKIGILFFIWSASLLISFGNNTPIYKLFYNYFPFFNKFRAPMIFLIVLQFSTILLSGLGLDYLLKNKSKWKNNLKYASIPIIILLVSFFLKNSLLVNYLASLKKILLQKIDLQKIDLQKMMEIMNQQEMLNKFRLEMINDGVINVLGIFIIAILLFILFYKKIINVKIFGIGLLTLLFIDLYNVNDKIIHPKLMSSQKIKKLNVKGDIINYFEKDTSDFRVLPGPLLFEDNRWARYQIESVGGYHPAKLQNYETMKTHVGFNSPGFRQMLNIKYFVTLNLLDNYPLLFKGQLNYHGIMKTAYIYSLDNIDNKIIFPRYVNKYNTKDMLVNNLKNRRYSPLNVVYIKNNDNIINGENGIGKLHKYSKNADLISATIKMENKGLIVFSEIYYPNGWKCYVNNKIIDIIEVNGLLRGIYLDKGVSEIKMVFNPDDLKISRIISLFSFIIIGLGFLFGLIKLKKND